MMATELLGEAGSTIDELRWVGYTIRKHRFGHGCEIAGHHGCGCVSGCHAFYHRTGLAHRCKSGCFVGGMSQESTYEVRYRNWRSRVPATRY